MDRASREVDRAFREVDWAFREVDWAFREVDRAFREADWAFREVDRAFREVDRGSPRLPVLRRRTSLVCKANCTARRTPLHSGRRGSMFPTFSALSSAWLFLLAIPLVVFYFLKLRRPRQVIPSL